MIGRLSKGVFFNKNVFFITVPKPPMNKSKPVAPKPAPAKLKMGQLHLSTVASQLNLKEQTLRKQMANPKLNIINKQQLKMLSIINGKQVSEKMGANELPMSKKSPVVTIMGHVDHGKTTLIDHLRNSNIAEGEVGGITQKIGAFHINCHNQKITFIDTPGHEAFSNMRRRGARVTDLVVLIVASTEGVKKQTKQVIDLIIKDKIPTVVAITKIDLPNADVQSVEQALFEAGLNIQPRGGNIPVVHISAKTGQNVDLLSQLILEQTKDLKVYEGGHAEGIVLQAYQNSQGFNAMTLIVKEGTLKVGSILIIGDEFAKVKSMQDDKGNHLKEAKPGDAVQIVGIPNIPVAGDFIYEVQDENKARFIASKRKQLNEDQLQTSNDKKTVKTSKLRLDYRTRKSMYGSASNDSWINKFNEKEQELVDKIEELKVLAENDPKVEQIILQKEIQLLNHKEYVYQFLVNIGQNKNNFNVVMKFADRGIEQTIHEQLVPIIERIKVKHQITVNILKSDVGEITSTDIEEAATCGADIFSFGCECSHQASDFMNKHKVIPKVHRLIHSFLKDFEESSVQRKKDSIKGVEKGRGIVADVYPIKGTKKGGPEVIYIPGIRMEAGKIHKQNKIYVFRNGVPITNALFARSIKSFKKDMQQVKKGDECTFTLDISQDFKFQKGDELVGFEQ